MLNAKRVLGKLLADQRAMCTMIWSFITLGVIVACFMWDELPTAVALAVAVDLGALAALGWFPKLTYALLAGIASGSVLVCYTLHSRYKTLAAQWSQVIMRVGNPPLSLLLALQPELPTPEPASALLAEERAFSTEPAEYNLLDDLAAGRPAAASEAAAAASAADLFRIEPLSWTRQSLRWSDQLGEFLKHRRRPKPLPLWDRKTASDSLNGLFRSVYTACEGYPDIRSIATAEDPKRELLALARNLPDQQRRQRLLGLVELLQSSKLLADSASGSDTGEFHDLWSVSTLIGALIGVSNSEYQTLHRIVHRGHLIEQLSAEELGLFISVTEDIAEFAASQPVRRNTTYEFIVSGRPLEQAPNNLVKLLSMLKSSTGGRQRQLADEDDLAWQYASTLDEVIGSRVITPARRRLSFLHKQRKLNVTAGLVMAGWLVCSLIQLYISGMALLDY